jgi:hypothetical protein
MNNGYLYLWQNLLPDPVTLASKVSNTTSHHLIVIQYYSGALLPIAVFVKAMGFLK